MRIYLVRFTIDTDYEYLYRICIIRARDEEDAKEIFKKYAYDKCTGQCLITEEEYEDVTEKENGILYQNAFKK